MISGFYKFSVLIAFFMANAFAQGGSVPNRRGRFSKQADEVKLSVKEKALMVMVKEAITTADLDPQTLATKYKKVVEEFLLDKGMKKFNRILEALNLHELVTADKAARIFYLKYQIVKYQYKISKQSHLILDLLGEIQETRFLIKSEAGDIYRELVELEFRLVLMGGQRVVEKYIEAAKMQYLGYFGYLKDYARMKLGYEAMAELGVEELPSDLWLADFHLNQYSLEDVVDRYQAAKGGNSLKAIYLLVSAKTAFMARSESYANIQAEISEFAQTVGEGGVATWEQILSGIEQARTKGEYAEAMRKSAMEFKLNDVLELIELLAEADVFGGLSDSGKELPIRRILGGPHKNLLTAEVTLQAEGGEVISVYDFFRYYYNGLVHTHQEALKKVGFHEKAGEVYLDMPIMTKEKAKAEFEAKSGRYKLTSMANWLKNKMKLVIIHGKGKARQSRWVRLRAKGK